MTALAFSKYEGLGNDFVVIDAQDEGLMSAALAQAICDRHRGVGADGVILVLPGAAGERARMRIFNADGSIPEMCGNGIRCLAVHVAKGSSSFVVGTDAGPKLCEVDLEAGAVRVDMGVVRATTSIELDGAGRTLRFLRADAGNPHAVTFDEVSPSLYETLGPAFSKHQAFPEGANIEFARMSGEDISVVVWERGSGLTLACGTGACATVAVAAALGHVPRGRPVTVHLPGGALRITHEDSGRTLMEGPARKVFDGVYVVRGHGA